MMIDYSEQIIELISNSKASFANGQYHKAYDLARYAMELDENCADAYQ